MSFESRILRAVGIAASVGGVGALVTTTVFTVLRGSTLEIGLAATVLLLSAGAAWWYTPSDVQRLQKPPQVHRDPRATLDANWGAFGWTETSSIPVLLADGRHGFLRNTRWKPLDGLKTVNLVADVYDPNGVPLSSSGGTVIGRYWPIDAQRWRFEVRRVPTDRLYKIGYSSNKEWARDHLLRAVRELAPKLCNIGVG